ncbi:MAG: hypothetical protein ACKPKO_32035, partial [Candidatus Fonsibacter sp.]
MSEMLLPAEAGDLKANNTLKFATKIRHVFYKASPGTWRNLEAVGGLAKERRVWIVAPGFPLLYLPGQQL